MFIGSLPDPVAAQMLRAIDFSEWTSAQVLCSGSFKIERLLNQRFPLMDVHGNDVSLLSVALGALGAGQALDFAFIDKLAWLANAAPAEASLRDRTAAILIAQDAATFGQGKPNLYKTKHLAHIQRNLPDLFGRACAKIDALRAGMDLRGFYAGDFRTAMRNGIKRGGGIIGFPPTYRGGYEAQYRFLNANIDWQPPAYDVFDPKTLPDIIDELADSGAFFEALIRVKGHSQIHNAGIALGIMAELAVERIEQMELEDGGQTDAEENPGESIAETPVS